MLFLLKCCNYTYWTIKIISRDLITTQLVSTLFHLILKYLISPHLSSCHLISSHPKSPYLIEHLFPILLSLFQHHHSSSIFPGILTAANEAIISKSCVEKVSEYSRPWILEREDSMSQWAQHDNQLVCLCVPNTTSRYYDHSDDGVVGHSDGDGDSDRRSRENCCFVFVKHHSASSHDDISNEDKEIDENYTNPHDNSEGEKDLFSLGERRVLLAAVAVACRSTSHSHNTYTPGILDQGQESIFF